MTDNNTALKKAGLKVTLPRLKILEVLQEPDNHHVSAEDLYKRLIDMGEEIGLATVYRVLNQFDDAGIVTRHNFEGGKSVFELTQQHHHDHLICLDCGKVIEFSDDSIEARQREIAARHGIRLTNHSLYLYGHCAEGDCREDEHAHDAAENNHRFVLKSQPEGWLFYGNLPPLSLSLQYVYFSHPDVYGELIWSFASYAILCALLKPAAWAAPRLI
jgi:Fur family ferric uptake transcriptional regulator